jgi:hypothetical protein
MSDEPKPDTKPQEQPTTAKPLPSQASPQDTSNWDDRPFTTPSGRVVIETFEGGDDKIIVAE